MNINNFYKKIKHNPLCLFCNSKTEFCGQITNLGNKAVFLDEYQCFKCNEFFSSITTFNINKLKSKEYFLFTLEKDKEVIIDLENKKIALNKFYKDQEDLNLSSLYWLPYFDLDFSNKNKLKDKINTYFLLS